MSNKGNERKAKNIAFEIYFYKIDLLNFSTCNGRDKFMNKIKWINVGQIFISAKSQKPLEVHTTGATQNLFFYEDFCRRWSSSAQRTLLSFEVMKKCYIMFDMSLNACLGVKIVIKILSRLMMKRKNIKSSQSFHCCQQISNDGKFIKLFCWFYWLFDLNIFWQFINF